MEKIKVDAYVACDGEQFVGPDAEEQCKKHEYQVISDALNNLGDNAIIILMDRDNYIHKFEPNPDNYYSIYLPEGDAAYIYIKNHEGMDAINILFGYLSKITRMSDSARYYTKDDIGKISIIRHVDCYEWCRDHYHLFERIQFLANQATRMYRFVDKNLGTQLGEIQTIHVIV